MVKSVKKPDHSTTDTAWLVIAEGDEVRCIGLDRQPRWTLGRETPVNTPDIPLHSPIAGRVQGELIRIGKNWFYCEGNSTNGTFYKGKHLPNGRRVRPVILESGDILSIGPGGQDALVWLLFTTELRNGEVIPTGGRPFRVTGGGLVYTGN